MSGTTRSAQQPLDTPSFAIVLAGAVIVLAATLAIAWGTANLGKMTQGAAPAPAPLTAPAIRDLGSRDLGSSTTGLAPNPVHDLGSRDLGSAPAKPFQGAPGAYRGDANATSAGHAGLRAQ
jgi:hypothetical protein